MLRNLFHVFTSFLLAVFVIFIVNFVYTDLTKYGKDDAFLKREKSGEGTNVSLQSGKSEEVKLNDSYSLNNPTHEFDKNCDEKFNDTLQDNLRIIENYPGREADFLYMWKIGGNFTEPLKRRRNPVLVTAASKSHFSLLMGMLKAFHHAVLKYRSSDEKIDLIVYDLGMTPAQIKDLMGSGFPCRFRKFPFGEFPPHVKIKKYRAWKPILIQILLVEFGFVWWVDTAIRFKTLNVDKAISKAKTSGLVYRVLPQGKLNSITKHTDIDTFKFLGEDRCKFENFPESDGSSVMVYFNSVSRAIVRAWAKCALDKNCVAPINSEALNGDGCTTNESHDGQCHHFDQSVFSILTRRIYHSQTVYSFNEVSEEIVILNRSDVFDHRTCINKICYI